MTSAQAAAPKTGLVAGSGTTSGGVFTAGSAGAEYQLPSQARLVLAPDTSVRIFPVAQPLELAPGSKTTTYSLSLLRGRVDIDVPQKPKSAVLCGVGKVSAVIAAGHATVIARGETSTLASLEGDVRALASAHWLKLVPGTVAHFNGEHASEPSPTAAPPALLPGQRLWLSAGAAVAITGLALGEVPNADHYELRLRAKDGSGEQLRRVPVATRSIEPFAPISVGEYEVATRSIDREGITGAWSKSELVRVVGVSLPPGGYVASGDIFIGKGQDIHFSNTDGLEMTYEGAGRYVPASEAVSLYRGETTVVSLRLKGSSFPTTARLRPRGIYAQVTLGPQRAVWPRDPVQISVEVRSREGERIPADLELKPDVKVGIEPIEVAFTRDGNRLTGTVPAYDKPGPWVLRVEVKDQYGALLGRDFLEIAQAAPKAPVKKAAARVASK